MENSKKGNLPLHHGITISMDLCPKTDDELDKISRVPYASAIGSIMYAMTCTRHDVSFALSMEVSIDLRLSWSVGRLFIEIRHNIENAATHMILCSCPLLAWVFDGHEPGKMHVEGSVRSVVGMGVGEPDGEGGEEHDRIYGVAAGDGVLGVVCGGWASGLFVGGVVVGRWFGFNDGVLGLKMMGDKKDRGGQSDENNWDGFDGMIISTVCNGCEEKNGIAILGEGGHEEDRRMGGVWGLGGRWDGLHVRMGIGAVYQRGGMGGTAVDMVGGLEWEGVWVKYGYDFEQVRASRQMVWFVEAFVHRVGGLYIRGDFHGSGEKFWSWRGVELWGGEV
ncbi:hypothetical protein Tco_0564481 [Tanacetum coccineum]